MLTPIQYGFLVIAAMAAGLINALAGGGSLITFPTLMAVGIPPVMANVTNTVALCPGYLGATLAQKKTCTGNKNGFDYYYHRQLLAALSVVFCC